MKAIKKTTAFLLILTTILGFSACKKDDDNSETGNATNVTIYEVRKDSINETASYTGEILGAETTVVSSQTSGIAQTIHIKEGDFVSEGTLLLSIDSSQYQLAYNQALAAYNSALAGKKSAEASYNSVTGGSSKQTINQLEAAMNSAKLSYDNALDIYNKQKTLFDMGAISQVEYNSHKTNMENAKLNYETAKSNYELTKNVVVNESEQSAKAGVETASAGVMQAKAALDIAANNLNNCSITAPISGYISSKTVSRGQMVAAGVSLFTITDTSSVEVQINVTESVILRLNENTKAKIDVASAELENIEGTISLINPVKNTATGLYTVKISVPNPDGILKSGMIAKLNLVTEEKENTITIPSEALIQSDDGEFSVYTANGDKAERKDVKTGISNDEFTEITSGLKPGDKVIVKGKDYLTDDNNQIRIVSKQGE